WERIASKLCFAAPTPQEGMSVLSGLHTRSRASRLCVPKQSLGTRRTRRGTRPTAGPQRPKRETQMSTTRQNRPRHPPGFTLIELLVVMSIIAFIAGLLVLLGPTLLKSEQASRGAQTLQGDLFIAKQQALRDRNPYGIRLLRESTVSTDPNYNVVR